MILQVLERVLQDCGYDVDSAIKRLNELSIGSAASGSSAEDAGIDVEQGKFVLSCCCPKTRDSLRLCSGIEVIEHEKCL